MSQSQTFNNTVYQIPVQGDTKWAPPLTRYLAALGTYAISPAGGTYTLTADLNLGPTFGLLTAYYKSASSNIAATGIVRLAQADTVSWRNVANSADLALAVNGSNQLTFNGSTLNTLAIPVTVPNGGTGLTSTTINGVLIGGATTTGALQNVGTGSINQVLTSAGAGLAPVWSAIGTGTVNTGTQYQLAYYSTSSNIVSGLTLLTGNKALASDVNGLPVASATTDTELGYVSGVTSAIQTQLNGKLSLTGGTMSGAIAMGAHKITGLTNGSATDDAAAFGQIASALTSYLPLAGGTMTGAIAMGSHKITGLTNGSAASDAAAFGQITVGVQKPVFASDTVTQTSTSAGTYVATSTTASITPTSASNRIKVEVSGSMFSVTAGQLVQATVKRGSTDTAPGAGGWMSANIGAANTSIPISFSFIDSPATTSATTYTVNIKSNSANQFQWGGNTAANTITLTEVQ